MVHYLINQVDGDLDRSALDQAKIVLKRFFLICILEEKEESIKRFQAYFGWEFLITMLPQLKSNHFVYQVCLLMESIQILMGMRYQKKDLP